MYKSGTGTRGLGHWDACVGTCDLVTQDEVWDAGTCGTGTQDVKYRDAGTSNTGTRGMFMIIAKMRYFFLGENVLFIVNVRSIVQNHIGHLVMFTKNISFYRSKRTDNRN